MKRLSTLAAAMLLTLGAQAQTSPPPTSMPPSVGTSPTMPAEVTPGSVSADPPSTGATGASGATAQPGSTTDAASGSGTGTTAQDELRSDRQAARTELQRTSREAAAAQRDAMAARGTTGELSTPQQDRGGLAGLGAESEPMQR